MATHYGDPVAEQRALLRGDALVELTDRAVITLDGPDRLSWLDSISSQMLLTMQPGDSSETLILTPNGRIEFALRLIDDGSALWVLTDASAAEALVAWLTRMRFTRRVEITDRSDEFATLGRMGESAPLPETVRSHSVPLIWRDSWATVRPGGHQYAAHSHTASLFSYSEQLVARDDLDTVFSAHPRAGTWAVDALHIAAWRPRFATEVDDKTIPHELDWLRSAVHLDKGCYRGQETVAKVHNLGHPPRRLVMVHLDGSENVLPEPGADVVNAEDTVVGRITSSARHHELGPIALAVVRRSTDPQSTLAVVAEGVRVAAAQEVIVPPDAGATASVPRLPRLGAVRRPSS